MDIQTRLIHAGEERIEGAVVTADLPELDLCLARRAGLQRHPLSPPEQHAQSPRVARQAGCSLRQ